MGLMQNLASLLLKMGHPPVVGGVILLWLTMSGAGADEMEDGYQALHRGDFATALQLFDHQAHQGNRYARYNLGVMYLEGVGGKVDPVSAYMWFQLAARQGDHLASQSAALLLPSLTPGQLFAATQRIRQWDKK